MDENDQLNVNVNYQCEKLEIEEIKQLASNLYEKWSKLPVSIVNYNTVVEL